MADKKIFAARDNLLTVAGMPITKLLVPEGFIKFSPPAQFGQKYGVGGDVVRWRTSDPLVPVDITLFASSPHNQFFSGLHIADTLRNTGDGVGIFGYEDPNGATLIGSDSCWIVQAPEWEGAEESKPVTWKFMIVCPPEQRIFGGN